MAGARALLRAAGVAREDFGKPIVAVAASGGAIALVQNGDTIAIDIPGRSIALEVDGAELARRRAEMEDARGYAPVARERAVSPALRAYAAMATSADTGAVRDVSVIERAAATIAKQGADVPATAA
jgi:dihydroxy-acid dehydratase